MGSWRVQSTLSCPVFGSILMVFSPPSPATAMLMDGGAVSTVSEPSRGVPIVSNFRVVPKLGLTVTPENRPERVTTWSSPVTGLIAALLISSS